MAVEADVLVIGGGLAGRAAALAAAGAGARTGLVSHKESTLRQASGLVDVLGYGPEGDLLADPFAAIPDLPAGHPYERVGVEAVRAGLALFDEHVGGYVGGHTDRNALVPTHGGTVKPTARYPETTAAGLASDPRDALLVGFETLPSFDAPLAAAHLANAGVPFGTAGVTLSFPGGLRADATATRYAHALDRDADVRYGDRELGARQALAEAVKPHLDGHERVGFPAVLGDDCTDDIRLQLEAELGAGVFEVPMGPPSLPGLRLADQFDDALAAAGVRVETGTPVVGAETAGGRVERVLVDRGDREVPYAAGGYVLATGGPVGGGVDSDREGVREPVFDCHVPHPDDRYAWADADAFGDHAFARFGVDVDRGLRPLDAAGDVEYANLRAAGAVLGGADAMAAKAASGISLSTGRVAGTRAAEEVA